MLICPLCIFFAEVSVNVFGPYFNWIACFLLLTFKSSLYILGKSLLKYCILVSGLYSNSLDIIFCRTEILNVNEGQLVNYFFRGIDSLKWNLKRHHNTRGHWVFSRVIS